MNITGVSRVLILGPIIYVAVWFSLRILGKRTLSTMNAFDLLVTVALGSTVANVILSNNIGIVAGLLAIVAPIALQVSVAFLSSRSNRAERLIKGKPAILLYDGVLLEENMRHELVTEEEIREAVRKKGLGSIDEAHAVVLEVDGNLSVVGRHAVGDESNISDLDDPKGEKVRQVNSQ